MKYLIKNGRVIDPLNKRDMICDVLVSAGVVERIAEDITEKADQTIDANGMIVAPGFVDMHVHLREPGREDKETIKTGTRSAIRGGFTSVACMPNTDPAIDTPEMVRTVKAIIDRDSFCHVYIIGAMTAGRQGAQVTDMAGMKKEGIIAVSDDGSSVDDAGTMLSVLEACKKNALLATVHCEDKALAGKGVMNKGFISTKMGLKGIPREAEYSFVKRDIELAQKSGARLHIAHVSCKESVDAIRAAKKSGVPVTAETAPHYFALTEECCVTYDTNTKMNPPLRAAADVEAVKAGLADGTIDVIATDHAPHTDAEKDVEFDYAPFGIIGLETALSLSVMELVDKKVLSWSGLIKKLSLDPALILGVNAGSLKKGAPADIAIIDPEKSYMYAKDTIASRSKNSPFINWQLKAQVSSTFVGGKLMMQGGVFGK